MERPTPRPIKCLLVSNRGEIANRIISAARELDIETFAVYTHDDLSHTLGAAHSIKVPSPASYLNIQELVNIASKHGIDAVHPGYGFLSESAEFVSKMWEAGIAVVGPGWGILDRTGDKLRAKLLADECQVPTLPALKEPTNDVTHLRRFAADAGYPIMVKAVDGGGGRGIRLVRSEDQLESNARLAIAESPSKQVFAEKAAVDGYLHVEIQIIGDGSGNVQHLWERQCSIQRRYQKVVEIAPCLTPKRQFIAKIIDAAVRMAKQVMNVKYFSLGTFEFLANPESEQFFFLEINPRLQVEHTITESISGIDIVQTQLLIAQGASLDDTSLRDVARDPAVPPKQFSCQLRLTAENVHNDYSLSIGKISSFRFPSGNGIRVDTNLVNGHQTVVGSDFDSLLAKLIITAATWPQVVHKAKRALQDTKIVGVKTNLDILRGIVAHPDFASKDCDTRWLETNHKALLDTGISAAQNVSGSILPETSGVENLSSSASSMLFRKGDAWTIELSQFGKNDAQAAHHLQLTKVLRNEFPAQLAAEIEYTTQSSKQNIPYTLTLRSTTSSAAATTAQHRKGNPGDSHHVVIPFSGTLIEVMVDVGDEVKEGDVICVIRQMKMELEVRAPRAGIVGWLLEVDDGEEVADGTLAAELIFEEDKSDVQAKL